MYVLLVRIVLVYAVINFEKLPKTSTPAPERLYHFMDYNRVTNQLVIFGGNTNVNEAFNDVWVFDISNSQYQVKVPTNDQRPEPRINSGGFVDINTNCLYVFGGQTSRGPNNEMWKFNLDDLKWVLLDPPVLVPPPIHYFGFTKFDEDDLKFVVFGGSGMYDYMNQTWVYFLNSNTWENWTDTSIDYGQKPKKMISPALVVLEGFLYLAGGDISFSEFYESHNETYRQNLTSFRWERLEINEENRYYNRYLTGSFVYENQFFMTFGWSNTLGDDVTNIVYLNLSDPVKWEIAEVTNCEPRNSFSFVFIENSTFHIFGGYVDIVPSNSYIILDLEKMRCTEINPNYQNPRARMYQSMVAINGKLYMYGGTGFNGELSEMWKYDIAKAEWALIKTTGLTPGKRSSYSLGSEGNIIVLWGGIYNSVLYNDLFKFEILTSTWTKITSSGLIPTAKKGACLVIKIPKIFIFGGESSIGLTNELWQYDTSENKYTQILTKTHQIPSPIKYPSCSLITSKIFISMGSSEGEVPNCLIHSFDISTYTWKLEFDPAPDYYCNTLSALHIFNSRYVLMIGGEQWGTDSYKVAEIIDISENTIKRFETSDYFFAGSSAVFGSKVYFFGGGMMFEKTIRLSIPSYNFFSVDVAEFGISDMEVCSIGTYNNESACLPCSAGSYSVKENAGNCEKCKSGMFNSLDGASSEKQCYPCEYGSYTNKTGSTFCLDCLAGYYCPVGSSFYKEYSVEIQRDSNQPQAFKPKLSSLSESKRIFYYIIIAICTIGLFILAVNKKIKSLLPQFDIYKKNHNHDIGQNMLMKKNKLGGLFAIAFVVISIVLVITEILSYNYDRIVENKTLVPLVILNEIEDEFKGNITIIVALFAYGGDCINATQEDLKLNFENIEYSRFDVNMKKKGEDCEIFLQLFDCIIGTGSCLQVKLENYESYCSGIGLNVSSSSSIESKTSQVSDVLFSSINGVFRGFEPSVFNILVFPSLYDPDWGSTKTGYHLSLSSNAIPGSEFSIINLPFSSNLFLQINLNRSSNGLYTKRYYKMSILLMFSSLIGSVFGVMGAIGGVLRVFEGNVHRIDKIFMRRGKFYKIISMKVKLKTEINRINEIGTDGSEICENSILVKSFD